jgi:hypothetical protein
VGTPTNSNFSASTERSWPPALETAVVSQVPSAMTIKGWKTPTSCRKSSWCATYFLVCNLLPGVQPTSWSAPYFLVSNLHLPFFLVCNLPFVLVCNLLLGKQSSPSLLPGVQPSSWRPTSWCAAYRSSWCATYFLVCNRDRLAALGSKLYLLLRCRYSLLCRFRVGSEFPFS